jgi:hypothetical protein
MAETRETLKRELTTSKSLLTKLVNKINGSDMPMNAMFALYQDASKRFELIKTKQEALINASEDADEVLTDEITDYQVDMQMKLSEILTRTESVVSVEQSSTAGNSASGSGSYLKMPEMQLPKFADNSENLFCYIQFKSGFMNGLNAFPAMSNNTKFMYLRSQLSGKAYALIENLVVDETTFETAVKILDKEFKNRSEIFIATMSAILNEPPSTTLEAACDVVARFRTKMHELQKLDYDFSNNEASVEFVSMILRSKLPKFVNIEIGRLTDKSNPSYEVIIDNIMKVKMLLQDCYKAKPEKSVPTNRPQRFMANSSKPDYSTKASYSNQQKTTSNTVKTCKFCSSSNHYSIGCMKYQNYEQRQARARELKLCIRCLSSKHGEETCSGHDNKIPYPCKVCQNHNHVSPMCRRAVVAAVKQ